MKAIITKQVDNARNYANEKETVSKFIVLGKINGEQMEVVDCRVYMSRSNSASTVYASIWVHGADVYTTGKGTASGYGYHKRSAAIGSAISSAGIELYGDCYGSNNKWNYEEKRENSTKEIAAIKRRNNKKRAHIGGVGDSAVSLALLAIAKAAGARGKLTLVSM